MQLTNFFLHSSTGKCKLKDQLAPCIAVIDEADGYGTQQPITDWNTFRTQYPDRPFCLLIPKQSYYYMNIPPDALADPTFQWHIVTRDGGTLPPDDWFTLCGLDILSSSNVDFIGLFVDISGSMDMTTVRNSYDKFILDIEGKGLDYCHLENGQEHSIEPFITELTPRSSSCTT